MELLFPDILNTRYDDTKELPELLRLYFKHVQTLLDSGTYSLEHLKNNIDQIAAQVEKDWLRGCVRSTMSVTSAHIFIRTVRKRGPHRRRHLREL